MVQILKNQITLFFSALFIARVESHKYENFQFSILVKQSGFHRTLCFKNLLPDTVKISSVLIEESLPKDMYVDPYQVSRNDGILIKDLIDCEVPAYLASSQQVILCSLSKTVAHEICVPVHFRYQVPHSCKMHGESATVEMDSATVTVKQFDSYSSVASLRCFEAAGSVIFYGVPDAHPVSFKIPVGCTEDFYSVLVLCAIVVPLSAIYLSLNLFKNNIFSNTIS